MVRPFIPSERTTEHRFFSLLALAILAVAVVGFMRTYLLVPMIGQPKGELPFTTLVHFHAVISFGWCIIFVIQTRLIAARKFRQHMKLGAVGVLLYFALVLTGPFVAVKSAARYGATPEDLAFLAVSTGNILAYTLLFGTALHWRRSPAVHKRLMTLGMVAMLTAPFGRLLSLPYELGHVVGPGLVVVALAWWDVKSRGQLHPITVYGGSAILLWELVPNVYMHSAWWLNAATWAVRIMGD